MEKAIIEAFIRFISFKGIHAKVIAEQIIPHQEYGQKLIEFLSDGDTTIFAVSEAGKLFLMNKPDSFQQAWNAGVRFNLSFSMPKDFWTEQVQARSMFFKMTGLEFAS